MKLRRQINLKQPLKPEGCFLFFIIALLIFPAPVMAKGFHLGIISAVKDQVKELKKKVDEKNAENRIELADNTKILSTATVDQLEKIEDNVYYFNTQATDIAGLRSGDIILSTNGEGFLRKVTNVATSGNQYVVYTTNATIEEAFKEFHLHLEGVLSPVETGQSIIFAEGNSGARPISGEGEFTRTFEDRVIYDADKKESTTFDRILADGSITAKFTYTLIVDSEYLHLKEVSFVLRVVETATLELKSLVEQSVGEEVVLYNIPFVPIYYPPPPASILKVTPIITIVAGVNATAGCKVTSKITQVADFTVGVTYLEGNWYPTGSYNCDYQCDPPSLTTAGEIKGYVGPKIEFKVWDCLGPYLLTDGYLKLDIDALPDLKWILYGGLEGSVGIDMTAFSSSLGKHSWDLTTLLNPKPEKEISSGEQTITNHAPAISILAADPATLYVNQVSTITCTASDADSDILTYTWDATRGTFTGSGSQVVYNATNSGTQTITCAVSDGNGGTDTESVIITVISNNAPVISSLTASPAAIILNQGTTITCTAADADTDTLTYTWSAASGTLTGSSAQATWTAPASSGTYTVSCLVSDGNGGSDSENVSVAVTGIWQTATLDTSGDVGAYPSLVFDNSNNPHISYYDVGNADLKYAKWTGSLWSINAVDSTGEVGEYTALDLDSSGYAHISYRDYTNERVKYAAWNGSSWSFASPINSGSTGICNTDIVLDTFDYPHVSCYEQDNNDLLYAWWNGFAWSWYNVDSSGRVGVDSSIAIDTSNNPHISYYDSTNASIKYASYNGSSWTLETVDTLAGGFTALALDSSNNPYIVYSGGGNGYLECAKWTGSAWNISTVDAVVASGYPAIVIDSNNNAHISYYDYTNKDLKYARWTGSVWVVMTVDSSGNQGPESSIALDTSGNPHIAYYDGTNGDLKYASWIP